MDQGRIESLIVSIFWGSTNTPSFENTCPKQETEGIQNSHLQNLTYNLCFH